ncbi:DUF1254 domain-containing protein [Actinoplanes sp. NPDC049118]|uniref:DUF1254 domain-containing protein n=1 Tax=Actinoplanes sp. NPDC049118 TaxID=3155769 RepID=UPI0034051030
MRLRAALALTITLTTIGAGMTPAGPGLAATNDYDTGYSLGQRAYEYGRPLLDTERVFTTATSIDISDTSGNGPVNQFNSLPKLVVPSPTQRTVVTPNTDTLYSLAWLDLAEEPQIIHVPAVSDRFYGMQLLSPWTENFYNITSAHGPPTTGTYELTRGGDFAVVPPGFAGTLPARVTRIDSPYPRVWVVGRTLIRGESDTAAVNAIQRQYGIVPLSRYGQPYVPPPVDPNATATFAAIPGTRPGDDPLDYYTALNRELQLFAPPAADRPLLEQLETIGVGPGLDPGTDPNLSADTLRGMRDAVTHGPANIATALNQLYGVNAPAHNGYLVVPTGTYGTNYRLRAIIDVIGLGALVPNVAVYPIALTDATLTTLTGANRYVLHMPASKLPPVDAFWSLTMYDAQGYFVPNPLDRFVVNDRSDLYRNRDGSIDIYVQHARPERARQARNWLPAPTGNFRLVWRLYNPRTRAVPGILSGNGWKPPKIQRCATDRTAFAH